MPFVVHNTRLLLFILTCIIIVSGCDKRTVDVAVLTDTDTVNYQDVRDATIHITPPTGISSALVTQELRYALRERGFVISQHDSLYRIDADFQHTAPPYQHHLTLSFHKVTKDKPELLWQVKGSFGDPADEKRKVIAVVNFLIQHCLNTAKMPGPEDFRMERISVEDAKNLFIEGDWHPKTFTHMKCYANWVGLAQIGETKPYYWWCPMLPDIGSRYEPGLNPKDVWSGRTITIQIIDDGKGQAMLRLDADDFPSHDATLPARTEITKQASGEHMRTDKMRRYWHRVHVHARTFDLAFHKITHGDERGLYSTEYLYDLRRMGVIRILFDPEVGLYVQRHPIHQLSEYYELGQFTKR